MGSSALFQLMTNEGRLRMESHYVVVHAGRQTDYSMFWQYFDNYILTASHYEQLDERVLAWYLTDDQHKGFYEQLLNSQGDLAVALLYRQDDRRHLAEMRKERRGALGPIYHQREQSVRKLMKDYSVRRNHAEGECIGFCVYEWKGDSRHVCKILALSIDPKSEDHGMKSAVWKVLEDHLYGLGVRELSTYSYQDVGFWKRNGFRVSGSHGLSKPL